MALGPFLKKYTQTQLTTGMAATVCKPPAISRITFNRFVRVRVPLRQKHVRLARTPTPTRTIYAWGFFKENLGLQKPSWLPDFSLHRRQSTLLKFFKNPPDREVYEDILHPDFKMHVGNETYSRQGILKVPAYSTPTHRSLTHS